MEKLDYPIGGYFELEISEGVSHHKDAISLNTGRNALEYVLITKKFKKVYLPYFTCEVVLEPFHKLNIDFEFYNIDENFEPIFDFGKLLEFEAFLYTNYFALKDNYISQISKKIKNLIIDNAQSFYSKPIEGNYTFYSPRKFFGVSDGAYLYTDTKLDHILQTDLSITRFSHHLKRIDTSAEEGYLEFINNDKSLESNPIKKMSKLTSRLLNSINYDRIAIVRKQNMAYLHRGLGDSNNLKLDIESIEVPMVYPYWSTKEIRMKLLKHKVYTATYWPNVKEWCSENDLEYRMMDEIVHLPIDQRYGVKEMELIVKIILNA